MASRLVEPLMQTIHEEPAWRTYVRSAAFIVPPLLAWAFIAVYVFPKYKQMWRDSRMMDSEFQWIMSSVSFGFDHMNIICALLALPVLMLEFTPWNSRCRRAVLAAVVFIFSTTILIELTGVCVVGAVAGPALVHR